MVLDQFEQWLHARRVDTDTPLRQALRQCDGQRLLCLVLVRDDFWLGTSRFMQALEIELVERQNMALVDLFDPLHARKVLAEFGRAYGRLPDNLGALNKDQDAFLNQAVEFCYRFLVILIRQIRADDIKGLIMPHIFRSF